MIASKSPLPTRISFRKVQITDAHQLHHQFWHTQPLNHIEILLRRATADDGRHRGIALVGIVDTLNKPSIIAFGQLAPWKRSAEISDLIVSDEWRGQGIGTHLIHHLIHAACQFGYHTVEIGADCENTRAIALYQRLGFQAYETRLLSINGSVRPHLYLRQMLHPETPK
jgi:ribosomal protein S18 acetylase RimI-like enzyme